MTEANESISTETKTEDDSAADTSFPSADNVKPEKMTDYISNEFKPWLQSQRDKGLIKKGR